MRTRLLIILFTCVCASAQAQVNFVKNPGFEEYHKCPDSWDQVNYAKYWSCAVDTVGTPGYSPEYYNICAGDNHFAGIPISIGGIQYPKSGNGMVGAAFFYDKTLPISGGLPNDFRDYVQGRLYKNLIASKEYCVSFWVNLAEATGYAHNRIGAYLDDGSINKLGGVPGKEILSVIPQVYSRDIIEDTINWVKIEGSFTSKGDERYITLGIFAPNDSVDTTYPNYYNVFYQFSYYFIDDVSVIPIDLPAEAGLNRNVETGKMVQIGRVGDTTALSLDCKWYRKGVLVDSGAIIEVKAASTIGVIDTYVVVQTNCGLVKSDTVTVTTVPLGMKEWGQENVFSVHPNPSDGLITITAKGNLNSATLKVYDLLGRTIKQQPLTFIDHQTTLNLDAPSGTYILEMTTQPGTTYRQRINLR